MLWAAVTLSVKRRSAELGFVCSGRAEVMGLGGARAPARADGGEDQRAEVEAVVIGVRLGVLGVYQVGESTCDFTH